MKFEEFSTANKDRCVLDFKRNHGDWSFADWMCAITGEIGEAANLIKKLKRGKDIDKREIGFELADAITYIDLLMQELGLDTGDMLREKFNVVSNRIGSEIKL